MEECNQNTYCKVYKKKLIDNLLKVKEITNKKIIAVVKGNAYGLGIVEVSKTIEDYIDMYAVSSIREADLIQTNKDILIMNPICTIPNKPKENYVYTIDSIKDLNLFNLEYNYRVNIYLNSGMNRLGLSLEEIDYIIKIINLKFKNIKVEGIYTHLHNASDIKQTKKQIDLLRESYIRYKDNIEYFHCLNSKGVVNTTLNNYADFTNAVRVGNIIYGLYGQEYGFKRAYEFNARVCKIYSVSKNNYIGYGSKHKVKKDTKVGIIEIGTIDKLGFKRDSKPTFLKDFLRLLRNIFFKRSFISFEGEEIYELCEPNMNCTLIDISHIPTAPDSSLKVNLNISPIQADSSIEKIYY